MGNDDLLREPVDELQCGTRRTLDLGVAPGSRLQQSHEADSGITGRDGYRMTGLRTVELRQGVLASNDEKARLLREQLKEDQTFLLNLMSSPGAGKTSTLLGTIGRIRDEFEVGVMEADIDGTVDAERVATQGTKVIQMHTGGLCHLDADMTLQGLEALESAGLDVVFLENVGNLVCPAEFDTGASCNVMILSVPEGDDKPLKYPLMFETADALLINKLDTLPLFSFDCKAVAERSRALNPDIAVFMISAKTGEGMREWVDWLKQRIRVWKGTK